MLLLFLLICTCTYNIRQRRIENSREAGRPGCEIIYPTAQSIVNPNFPTAPPAYASNVDINSKYGSIKSESQSSNINSDIEPPAYATAVNMSI